MSDARRAELALRELRRMTLPFPVFEAKEKAGDYHGRQAQTHGYKARALLDEIVAGAPPPLPHVPPPPPPPNAVPSVFHGRGLLATWNTEGEFRDVAPYFDWIALLARLPDTTRALADAIRSSGPHVLIWEDENSNLGVTKAKEIGALGYIGQGESAAQRHEKLTLGPGLDIEGIPKALVDNLDPASGGWPDGWVCIPETYEAANPNATVKNMVFEAKQRGATQIVPCFQLYVEGSQSPVWLEQFLAEMRAVPELAHGHWCGYSLDTVHERPADLDLLRRLGPVR